MQKSSNPAQEIRIICFSVGGYYALMSIGAILMIEIQNFMFSKMPPMHEDVPFFDFIRLQQDILRQYMPFLMMLGLGYVIFGLLFNRINNGKLLINIVLGVLCLIWGITYMASCLNYINTIFSEIFKPFEEFSFFAYVSAGFGFLSFFAVMLVPQIIIGLKIRKMEKQETL